MRKFLVFTVFLFSLHMNAQTGIGTSSPDASAKLEVAATNKGFLPPRVALTATNTASPITNPANGLMVFNTANAGVSPFQVVPGYYYWDGTGQQWVSLSTTVGNVQNQAIFRSTSNTTGGQVVSTWNSRFNNIAAGDLTVTSNTSFALSNGIYKIQWGLPYQSSQTYNAVQLQENINGTWGAWRSDAYLAGLANGGGTDWGGTSFMTDIIDCSNGTRTLRLYNPDTRTLFYGASFIITKLNPSITTSTTADNLGNHIGTKNIQLNGFYLSNDGGNEGIAIDNNGKVGIGNNAPVQSLDVTGTGRFSTSIINSGNRSYFGKDGANMHWFATTDNISEPNNLAYGFESNGSSIQSHKWYTGGTEKMKLINTGKLGIGTSTPATALQIENGNSMGSGDPGNNNVPSIYVYNNNNASNTANSIVAIRTAGTGSGKPYLSIDINGVSGYSMGINNPTDQLIFNTTWNFSTGSGGNNALIINRSGQSRVIVPSSSGGYVTDWPNGWGGGLATFDFSCAGIYYNTLSARSDIRLKNTINDLSDDLVNNYLNLRPVTYYWNNDKSSDTKLQFGLIAQEVEKLFPEMVNTGSDNMQTKSINYQALHALSLKVIQVQQAEINNLKKKQIEIEDRLLKLEAKLN